jgi:predicted ATP-dependent endonuclease of OLD family
MKVTHIKISNICGHSELEIAPGKVNVIKGANGVGKTSILTAIQAALRGGSASEATLLRKGEKKGEIVLVLDDGTEINKTVTEEGSKVKITGQSKPASFLDEIRDLTSVNPVQFLLADDKSRVRLLLETLNLQFTHEEIAKTGAPCASETMNLEQVDALRKAIYDERTGANGQAKKAKSTVEQLLRSLPEVPSEVSAEALADIETKRDGMQVKRMQFIAEIEREKAARIAEINAEFDAKKTELQTNFEAAYNPLTAEIATMQAALQNSAARQRQLDIIKVSDAEADELQEISDGLTATLQAIDQLKAEKMDNLPIENLLIKEGKIYLDGVAWEHINTARKVQFVLTVARMRAGALGLVCLDGLECLDEVTFGYFHHAAQECPELQFFSVRVTGGDLSISTN